LKCLVNDEFLGNAIPLKSGKIEVSSVDISLKFCSPYNFIAIFNLNSDEILTKLSAEVSIILIAVVIE